MPPSLATLPAVALRRSLPRQACAPYDRIAHRYDILHRRWLRYAGGEAQSAFEGAVRALLRPDGTLLDAGCGTGAFVRRLIAEGHPPPQIAMVDHSPRMLTQANDLSARRAIADLVDLPFEDACFDIVTCAWVLETVANPAPVLTELTRLLRPGGALCLTFCARVPCPGPVAQLLSQLIRQRGLGRLLCIEAVVAHLTQDAGLVVTQLPCRGPAAALIARRPGTSDVTKERRGICAGLRGPRHIPA